MSKRRFSDHEQGELVGYIQGFLSGLDFAADPQGQDFMVGLETDVRRVGQPEFDEASEQAAQRAEFFAQRMLAEADELERYGRMRPPFNDNSR